MRKTLNINLGRMAFIIDENAFELLHQYLETLKTKFSNESERDEILNDIEARIAEMLTERLANRKEVVAVQDVQSVIAAMGKPEDIAGEEDLITNPEKSSAPSGPSTIRTEKAPRRLFRDPDDEKVAGVIAGLCHYFGISDPTWVRLAVVILSFFSFGTVLLAYFLLAIVIPKASTSAEKLQMKGEPVNISTIEKEIKGAVNKAGESVNRFVREETFFEKLWGFTLTVIKGLFKVVAAFIIIIGLVVIFALIAALFGVSIAGNALLAHAPYLLIETPTTISIIKAGLVLFIAAPVIGLIYGALRLIFGKRTHAPLLKWGLIGTWLVGVVLLAYGAFSTSREFGVKATKNEVITLMQPPNGTLFIQLTDTLGNKLSANDEDEDNNFNFQAGPNGLVINGINIDEMETIPIGEPWLQLMASDNDSFYVQKMINTRGKNKGDALTNSGYVIYNFSQTDTVLNLPGYLYLDKNGKYRFQEMKIRIAIPEGKQVSFADNIDRWKATVKGDGNYDDTYFANTTWTTENGRVKCIKGENHFNSKVEEELEEELEKIEKKIEQKVKKLESKVDSLNQI